MGEHIEIKKETLWKIATLVFAALWLFALFGGGSSTSTGTGNTVGTNTAPTGNTAGNIQVSIDSDDPVIGDLDAGITVYKFTDFSCPYCAMASGDNPTYLAYAKQNFGDSWEPIGTNLLAKYVDTGDAKFVVKYSQGHSGAHAAQEVAWCMNEQGLFREFYAAAFANFDDVEDLAKMKTLAGTLGADSGALDSCIDSGRYDSKFATQQAQMSAAGGRGTPYFVIVNEDTGEIATVSGAVPWSQFETKLKSVL